MLEKLQFITLMLINDVKATRTKGATAVEYGLMVALIAVAIIAAVDRPRHQPRRPLHRRSPTLALIASDCNRGRRLESTVGAGPFP